MENFEYPVLKQNPENSEESIIQFKLDILLTDHLLMIIISDIYGELQQAIINGDVPYDKFQENIDSIDIEMVSNHIYNDLIARINGKVYDNTKHYNELKNSVEFDTCLDIFKRIKDEMKDKYQKICSIR